MGLRLLCCAVIFSCSAFIGLELRRRLSVRLRSLQFFREYFRSMRSYISHFGMSLDDIVNVLNKRENAFAFSDILREKTQHSCFPLAFTDTLYAEKNAMSLSDEDVSYIGSLVTSVGSSDIDGALEVLCSADGITADIREVLQHILFIAGDPDCGADVSLVIVLCNNTSFGFKR